MACHLSLSFFEYILGVSILLPWSSLLSLSWCLLSLINVGVPQDLSSAHCSSYYPYCLAAPALQRVGGRPAATLLKRTSARIWDLKETKNQRKQSWIWGEVLKVVLLHCGGWGGGPRTFEMPIPRHCPGKVLISSFWAATEAHIFWKISK